MVYSWTFTAATPNFHCRTPFEDRAGVLQRYTPTESQCQKHQKLISVSECQKCFQMDEMEGTLKPCTNYTFDRTYYQSTLVEEV